MTDRSRQSRGQGLERPGRATRRAQSHVVGVVLLLGITAIAMAGLTAAVGEVVTDQTDHADATRVANEIDEVIRPAETTGHREGDVTFSDGSLSVVDRQVRVRNETHRLATVDADALVFESGDRRAAFVAGGIVRGRGEGAWAERDPTVTAGPDVLVIGVPRLNGTGGVSGTGGVATTVATNVSHERTTLGRDDYQIAVETATPAAFERYVESLNATATVRDIDGDGVPSVVVDFDGTREAHLVVHDVRLEVGHG